MQATDDNIEFLIGQLRKAGGSGATPPPLNTAQNGGNGGGMEARVAVLEAHIEHVRSGLDRLADVPAKLATLEVKVDALPTKDYLSDKLRTYITLAVAGTGALCALITVAVRLLI